jgi:hypothetical protein
VSISAFDPLAGIGNHVQAEASCIEGLSAAVRAIPGTLRPGGWLSRCLCQAHREQRLCNWIVGDGTQNILVAAGGLIEFTSLEI